MRSDEMDVQSDFPSRDKKENREKLRDDRDRYDSGRNRNNNFGNRRDNRNYNNNNNNRRDDRNKNNNNNNNNKPRKEKKQEKEIDIDDELPAKRVREGPKEERDSDTNTKKSNTKRRSESNILERFEVEYKTNGADEPIWDFNVSNDLDSCGKVPNKETIEPELEYERFLQISNLRTEYGDLCKRLLSITPPEQSFNRWLFAQLTTPMTEKQDSFLSLPDLAIDLRVLRYEIQRNIPHSRYIKFQYRDSVSKLKEFISEYHTSSLAWISQFFRVIKFADMTDEIWSKVDKNSLLKMKVTMEEEIARSKEWLLSCNAEETTLESLKTYFSELADKLLEHQSMGLNTLVESLCAKLVDEAKKSIEYLRSYEKKKSTKVKLVKGKEICEIVYGSDSLPISRTHYMKLYTLYMLHTKEDEKLEFFLDRLYVLLRRYQTFFGNQNEGAAMHAAAMPSVFQYLKNNFGVQQEMFASPLNCYFSRYNSAFPDIDIFFGSLGSFFDFRPTTGSFEVGPPYTEEVMHKMALQLDELLFESEDPLSFVVFVPDWREPLSPGLVVLEASTYLKGDFVIKGRSYNYVVGHQHNELVSKRYWKIPFDTHIYILQNKEGSEKWPVTDEFLEKFKNILLGL